MARTRDDDARQRILAATRQLISHRGPQQVGIEDIASEAGVGKQTIYRWWRSRTAVILDALAEIAEDELAFPDTGSTKEDLRQEMRRVARTFKSPIAPLIREIVAAAQGDPTVAEELRRQLFTTRRCRAVETLRRGIDRGEVRADIDLETAVDALYAPMWLRLIIGHQHLTRSTADKIIDIVWPGIAHEGSIDGR